MPRPRKRALTTPGSASSSSTLEKQPSYHPSANDDELPSRASAPLADLPYAAVDAGNTDSVATRETRGPGWLSLPAGLTVSTLLQARPLLSLLDELRRDHALLTELMPRSDGPHLMATLGNRVMTALAEAMQADPRVGVAEAARRLGRSESSVRQWIAVGKLPALKRGRGYAIRVADLQGR
jgi:excisionase family DNA binding protein